MSEHVDEEGLDQDDVVRRRYALDAAVDEVEKADAINAYYCYTAEELTANFGDASGFLVEGMLPEHGIVCFVGEAGVGKTRIVYDLMRAVLRGESWLGKSMPAKKGGVLLLDHEMGPEMVAKRLKDHSISKEPPHRFAIYTTGLNALNQKRLIAGDPDGVQLAGKKGHRPPDHLRLPEPKPDKEDEYLPIQEQYIDMLAERVGAKIIVFDSMRHSHMADENKSQLMGPLMDVFRRLARDRLVILIHHGAKRKNDDEELSARGSGEILASLDVCIKVQRGGKPSENSLTWTKVRGWEVRHEKVTYDRSTLLITTASDQIPGIDPATVTTRAVVAVLQENGWLSAEDILESMTGKMTKRQKKENESLTLVELWEVINIGVANKVFVKRRAGRGSKKSEIGLMSWET